ncbi:MAG TPA: transposase [Gammaproteobacteria bacterium]|nr:transposase [Gammaproteobacteria bacterium]
MARLPRIYVKNQPQHIIQRGNNREPIFVDKQDYLFYLKCLQEAVKNHELHVHAYVLMTNHVHLLASPQQESSTGKVMQSIGRRYVQYFNYRYDRTGTLWEGRYKSTLIDSEQYLLICMRYIELNPVRANMVSHPKEYRWSSHRINALSEPGEWIKPHIVYRRLGNDIAEREKAYRALFRNHLPLRAIEDIREATNKAWVLGPDRFKKKMERLAGRRSAPLPKGRPRQA